MLPWYYLPPRVQSRFPPGREKRVVLRRFDDVLREDV
jgi:hypothetical protein